MMFEERMSVPAIVEATAVTTAESGIITDTTLAEICFKQFVLIIQQNADETTTYKTRKIKSFISGEKTIFSITDTFPAESVMVTVFNTNANTSEITSPITLCTARYKGALSFFAKTAVPAMLKP